jgi:2-octaprenyl-6-methoxyphenol hydroxylase
MKDYDILVVGAGIVGTSLVLALSRLPLRIALLEQTSLKDRTLAQSENKPIALNYASIRILQALIPWSALSVYANPIETVHISEQGCFAAARIRAQEMGVTVLGYVIPAAKLGEACINTLLELAETKKHENRSLDLFNPAQCNTLTKTTEGWKALVTTQTDGKQLTIHARLVIAADGSHSSVRNLLGIGIRQSKEGGQKALVTTLNLARHHNHTAYQRFTNEGVIACLPLLGDKVGLVWTAAQPFIDDLLLSTESDFLARLQAIFAYRLGKFLGSSKLRAYSITSFIAELQAKPGLILLGNTAHTLSPIAAQGLNLALQDMAELADILTKASYMKKDLADPVISQTYLATRSPIQKQLIGFTENLAGLFKQKFSPLTLLRNNGLLTFDLVSPLKKNISRRLMGIHGRLPALASSLVDQQKKEYVKI